MLERNYEINKETKKTSEAEDSHHRQVASATITVQSIENNTWNGEIGPKEKEGGRRFNDCFHHYRYLVVLLGGLAGGCMLLQRYTISVALLNMVNQTHLYLKSNPDKNYDDFIAEGYSEGGEFNWDNETQNIIMSCYMLAYTLPMIGTTKLALTIGPRISIPVGLIICATSNLLIPVAAYWGWHWVVALRLVNGVGASVVLPLMFRSIEQWMGHGEASLGLSISQAAQGILSSSSSLVAGCLASAHWTLAFYVPGTAGALFGLIYFLLVTDNPEDNWLVSEKELIRIREIIPKLDASSVGGNGNENGSDSEKTSRSQTKQASIVDALKVASFYAYLLLWTFHCSATTSSTFLQPTYLRQFLHIQISETGLLNSLIESGTIVANIWPHPIYRVLQSRLHLSPTAARRFIYALMCSMVASTWLYTGAFHQYQLMMLFVSRSFSGGVTVIIMGSLMGNFGAAGLSSMAYSVMNTVGNMSTVFVSPFFGWFLDKTGQSEQGWFWIFFMISMSQLINMVIFGTLIRSDPIVLAKKTVTIEQDKQVNQLKSTDHSVVKMVVPSLMKATEKGHQPIESSRV